MSNNDLSKFNEIDSNINNNDNDINNTEKNKTKEYLNKNNQKLITNEDTIKKSTYVKYNKEPVNDYYQTLDMYDNLIWKGFPIKERFWYSLCCKSKCTTNLKTKDFVINDILKNPSILENNINLLEKIVYLKINKTGFLDIHPNLIHPYVKISFVNLKTLRYLQKENYNKNTFSKREKSIKVSFDKEHNNYEYKESDMDYIYPVSTSFFDLRDKGETFAEWNEGFIINEPASNIFDNSTIIFFEILDFNMDFKLRKTNKKANIKTKEKKNDYTTYNKVNSIDNFNNNEENKLINNKSNKEEDGNVLKNNDNLLIDKGNSNNDVNSKSTKYFTMQTKFNEIDNFNIPIAWGYLKPVGYSQTFIGKFKIQLYKYKYKQPSKYSYERKTGLAFQRTPDVLFEFNWIKREMYQTYLEIEIHLENKPKDIDLNQKNSKYQTLWKYKLSSFYNEGIIDFSLDYTNDININKLKAINNLTNNLDDINFKKNKFILKIKRHVNDKCLLPNKIHTKLQTDKLGCMSLSFSPNGKYIACGCTKVNSNTTIKIYNVIDKELKYHFIGHSELVHNIEWNNLSNILVTCGSDFRVNIWSIPLYENSNNENTEYLDNEKKFLLTTIQLSNYVYYTIIINVDSTNNNALNNIVNNDFNDLDSEYKMLLATASADGYIKLFIISFLFDNTSISYKHESTSLIYQYNIAYDFYNIDNKKFRNSHIRNKILNLNTAKSSLNKSNNNNNNEIDNLLETTVFDKRYPNALASDNNGRFYVGDSLGYVHIWDIQKTTISNRENDENAINENNKTNSTSKNYTISKIKSVTHKHVEGDAITKILISPFDNHNIIIQTKDNSIRLINPFGREGKLKILNEYKGFKCNKLNIKSALSPDGQYLISGNEEGNPVIWQLETGFNIENKDCLKCGFVDAVNDVSWNSQYNMVAVCGFGQEYPVILFTYERSDKEIDIMNSVLLAKEEGINNNYNNNINNAIDNNILIDKDNNVNINRTNFNQYNEVINNDNNNKDIDELRQTQVQNKYTDINKYNFEPESNYKMKDLDNIERDNNTNNISANNPIPVKFDNIHDDSSYDSNIKNSNVGNMNDKNNLYNKFMFNRKKNVN